MTFGTVVIMGIMLYTLAAVVAPGIRFPLGGSDKRIGTVTALGMALFFWGPATISVAQESGFISEDFGIYSIFLVIVAIGTTIGGRIADSHRV